MKALPLALALLLTTSCLKKKEEETSSSSSDDKKDERPKEKDDEKDDDQDAHHPLYGKWKFTMGEDGLKVFTMVFNKTTSMPNKEECAGDGNGDAIAIYWQFDDNENLKEVEEYETCKKVKENREFSWNSNSKLFTVDEMDDGMKLTKSGETISLKVNPMHDRWIIHSSYVEGEYLIEGTSYQWKFEKANSTNIPQILACDDPEFIGMGESVYVYDFFINNTYSMHYMYRDINGNFCDSMESPSGYNYTPTTLTFLDSIGGNPTVIYETLFQDNNNTFYLNMFF